MAGLNDVLNSINNDADGAVGCAVVDLGTGLMLGVAHKAPYFSQSYLDAVAASAVDIFRGKTVSAVEKLISSARGEKVDKSIKEIQMTTDNTYHFMSIVPDKPDALVVLITTKKANLGMGWSALKNNMANIQPLCP